MTFIWPCHKDKEDKDSCELCEEKFSRKDALQRHIKEHHRLKLSNNFLYSTEKFTGKHEFKCKYCPKHFTRKENAKVHSNYYHRISENQICYGNSFMIRSENSDSLEKDEMEIDELNNLTHENNVEMRQKTNFVKQITDKMKQCVECNKKLTTESSLRRHIDLVHKNPKKPKTKKDTTCNECGKVLSCLRHLKNHQKNIHKNDSKTPKNGKPKAISLTPALSRRQSYNGKEEYSGKQQKRIVKAAVTINITV